VASEGHRRHHDCKRWIAGDGRERSTTDRRGGFGTGGDGRSLDTGGDHHDGTGLACRRRKRCMVRVRAYWRKQEKEKFRDQLGSDTM